MNEELQKELLNLIKDGKDFVLSQAPDVIQQYVGASAAEASIGIIAAGVGLIVLTLLATTSVIEIKKDRYIDPVWPILAMLCGLGLIVCFIFFFCSLSSYYQITKYPKGYLMRQAIGK